MPGSVRANAITVTTDRIVTSMARLNNIMAATLLLFLRRKKAGINIIENENSAPMPRATSPDLKLAAS